jgi:predicted nucleic acid-binding Zn ribbon protein
MPIYSFVSDDEKSPYYNVPKEMIMTIGEYEKTKDEQICEETGSKLRSVIRGRPYVELKGSGWYDSNKH